jgi:hypothetical protein
MSTTTNLALNEPAYNSPISAPGDPTWNVPLNYNSTILDQMFGNTTGVSVNTGSTPTYTLITAPSSTAAGSTSQAMRFNLTGALAASQTVLLPQGVAGMWIVSNNTTGAFTVTIGSNNGSNLSAGTTVSVPQNFNVIIFSDGTNVGFSDSGLLTSGATLTSLTVNGTSNLNGSTSSLAIVTKNIAETTTISAIASTGTINFDITTQSVLYYTTAASGNWTINIRGNSSTTLNSIMSVGQSLTMVFLAQNQNIAAVTATITIASPAVVTISGTLPANGTPVTFSTTGALPTGLTVGTVYYVVNASGSTFNVAATVGGSAIITSGSQSGTQTVTYYGLFNNVLQIDGTTITPKWQGGSAPTSGNANSVDIYSYTILKTASATYTVFASQSQFA